MKQKDVFKKIGGILQELSDQYEYLKTVEDDLNDLELELFVSNAHFLTDHIEILCKLNLQNKFKRPSLPHIEKSELPEVTVVTSSQQKFFEPVVQQMKPADRFKLNKPVKPLAKAADIESEKPIEPEAFKPTEEVVFKPIEGEAIKPVDAEPIPEIDLTSETPQETYSVIQEEPETIRHELILDEADTWEDEDERRLDDEPIAIIDTEDTFSNDTEVIAGPIIPPVDKNHEVVNHKDEADEVLTINQKISSQQADKAISKTDQLAIKPISDIKLAITLNDKLLYVKDLFNGYNLAYSEAIEILNRFSSFEEASRFLKTNYVTKNNWDGKPATTEKFYALLKRRYA